MERDRSQTESRTAHRSARNPHESAELSPPSAAILSLQATAGNLAVNRMLGPVAVQRETLPATEPTFQSPDSDVGGKPVSVVAADLSNRAKRHRHSVAVFKSTTKDSQRQEVEWYGQMDMAGRFIDLFNSTSKTDPARWNPIVTEWDAVASELAIAEGVAAAAQLEPDTAKRAGQLTEEAIKHLHAVYDRDHQARQEFSRYLQGFTQSAQDVQHVATIVRDISFAAAVGVAVVVAAPVVAAGAGTVAASAGLTGTAATAATYGGTALAMGAMGAGMEGVGQGATVALSEGGAVLHDLIVEGKTWDEAVQNFNWEDVGLNTWAGMKRGFVDGVLAYAGLGFEKVLAKGASVALTKVLGQESATMLAKVLRTALTRAISGGVSGGVIGALDAGIKAALEGKSLAEIEHAMATGFAIGALAGAALGGAGGAFEGRLKALTLEVDELRALLASDPQEFARRYNALVESLTPEQRAAWDTEMQGRRFLDRARSEAVAADESGKTAKALGKDHGPDQFRDWQEAAAMLDEHARSGQPLTQEDVQKAHIALAQHLKPSRALAAEAREAGVVLPGPGEVRGTTPQYMFAGGEGGQLFPGMHKLSPEQLAILERNPHIQLLHRDTAFLSRAEKSAGYQTAHVAFPDGSKVQSGLDAFFAWYAQASKTMPPVELAERATREFVSIHPFIDGNGRTSRLIMDHALAQQGLPPALLERQLAVSASEEAWQAAIREGVIESYQLTLRHVDLFNKALQSGDPAQIATTWGLILALTTQPEALTGWLYQMSPAPAQAQ